MLRVDVNAVVRANRSLAVLAECGAKTATVRGRTRSTSGCAPGRARLRNPGGRVPPTFGAFPRRTYASDNLLIGYPLAYQYLTSLRPDAVPANADELLRMRGRGWLSNFSLGNLTPARGVPLVTAFRWDTGVQVHSGWTWGDATAP